RSRMLGIVFPPTFLARENRSYTRCIDNPARTNRPGTVAVTKCDSLFFSGLELHIDYCRRTQSLGTSSASAPQHLFIKRGTIQLIRRHTYLVKRPEFARFSERFYFAVCKPKPQSLLREMRLIEILRQPEHPAHEIGADLDGRFANPPRKLHRFFQNQYANSRILPQ